MVYIPRELRLGEAGDTRVRDLPSGSEDLALNPSSAASQVRGLGKVHCVPQLFYHHSLHRVIRNTGTSSF